MTEEQKQRFYELLHKKYEYSFKQSSLWQQYCDYAKESWIEPLGSYLKHNETDEYAKRIYKECEKWREQLVGVESELDTLKKEIANE